MKDLSVLAICYYGRSGSVFVQSLFDGHPECVTIPGTYIMGYQEWFDGLDSFVTDNVIDEFCGQYGVLFDPLFISEKPLPGCGVSPGIDLNFHQMGPGQNESLSVDKNDFMRALKGYCGDLPIQSAQSFFIALHMAYASAVGMDMDRLKCIVYALHTPALFRARFLSSMNVKILHVIRDPIQTAFSLYKHYVGRGVEFGLMDILNTISLYSPISGFDNVSYAVKLEDVHTDSLATLQRITDLIGVSWDDSLLLSTFGGKKWWNLKGTESVSGFNRVIISKTHEDALSENDRRKLQYVFRSLYKKWHYPNSGLKMCNIFAGYDVESHDSMVRKISSRVLIIKVLLKQNCFLCKSLALLKMHKEGCDIIPLL